MQGGRIVAGIGLRDQALSMTTERRLPRDPTCVEARQTRTEAPRSAAPARAREGSAQGAPHDPSAVLRSRRRHRSDHRRRARRHRTHERSRTPPRTPAPAPTWGPGPPIAARWQLTSVIATPPSPGPTRREDSDPAKAAALDADAGEAMTRTESMSEGDPRGIAKALLAEFGFGLDQFGCLDSLWTRESNWNPLAHNPSSGALRHPAIVARLQDGIGGVRLVLQPGHSDSLGPGLHPGPLRQPLRRLVAQPGPRLVLTVRAYRPVIPSTSSASSSCSSVSSPRST